MKLPCPSPRVTVRCAALRSTLVRHSLLCGALLLVVAAGAPAQPATAPTREPYRISPGDVVEIQVAGHPELSSPAPAGQAVSPDGRLRCLYAGEIIAEGSTCAEVEQRLSAALAGRIVVNPQVLVRVLQSSAQRVSVLGAVRLPGSYPYRAGMQLAEAVALAGGLQPAGAGNTPALTVRLLHRDGRSESVATDATLLVPAGSAPLQLRPGDTLLFEQEASVTVLGAVARPGSFAAERGLRLSELLAEAGGPVTGAADLQRVLINRRDGTVTECNLDRVLTEHRGEDPLIAPGEVIYIPRSNRQAIVLGCVQSPGKYDFEPGDRVSDLLGQARGPLTGSTRGDLSRMLLSRADGTSLTVNLIDKSAGADPELLPGDRLLVQEARDRIAVSGYVTGPGVYDLRPGDTVRSALAAARGVLPNLGDTRRVELRRAGAPVQTVDTEKENPELQAGDEISVPYASHRVAVLGLVNQPGLYDCTERTTLAEIVAAANGAAPQRTSPNYKTDEGDLSRVLVSRLENGKQMLQQVNLRLFLEKGQAEMNPTVQPGDVVFVPSRKRADIGGILRDLLVFPRLFDMTSE